MPLPKREDKANNAGLPVFNRLSRAGSGGLAAASIGWTLALCIVGGALAGIALDKHFGTQYWTPILFLLGVGAGFVQMMRTLGEADRISRQERAARQTSRASNEAQAQQTEPAPTLTTSGSVPSRMARVPAPPTASFDVAPIQGASASDVSATGVPIAPVALPPDVEDDLATLRQMLQEQRGEDREDPTDERPTR